MAVQLQQALEVGKYLVTQRLKGRKRFPLVLMLEPLFRCNLACSGCGKIQHPVEILKKFNAGRMLCSSRRMRRTCGFDSRRRTATSSPN